MRTPTEVTKTRGNAAQLVSQEGTFQKQKQHQPRGAGLADSLRRGTGEQAADSLRIQRKRTKKEKIHEKTQRIRTFGEKKQISSRKTPEKWEEKQLQQLLLRNCDVLQAVKTLSVYQHFEPDSSSLRHKLMSLFSKETR